MEHQIEVQSTRKSSKRTGLATPSVTASSPSSSLPSSDRKTRSSTSQSSISSLVGEKANSSTSGRRSYELRRKSLRNATGASGSTPSASASASNKRKGKSPSTTLTKSAKDKANDAGSAQTELSLASLQQAIARPRHSANSEQTSSTATSQRGNSPFSAPATPATAHSIATNVSASSHSRGRGGKQARSHDGLVASALAGLPTSDPLSGVKKTIADEKGKGRATSNLDKASTPGVTSSKRGLKRGDTSPPFTPNSKRSKSNPQGSSNNQRYSLRSSSNPNMAPKKQSSAVSGSSRPRMNARKGRSSREATAVTTHESEAAASCTPSDAMDVDQHHDTNDAGTDSFASHFEQAEEVESEGEDGQETHAGDDHAQQDGIGEDEIDDDDPNHEDGDDEDQEAAGHEDIYEDEDEGPYDDDDPDDPYGDGADGGGFGGHIRAMAGYMSGLSGRFRTLLTSLRNRKDPTAQLVALQELSEVLSISNEDTLAGYFPTETFVGELIYLMGGPKPPRTSSTFGASKEKSKQETEDDEEAEVLAAAAGLDDNGEMMLLACRCLANLIEAMPYAAHSVVSHGAVPVLNSKLIEIQFIDLAEQVLQTMEKISNEYPSAIVREGGLSAMLQYLDFFNIHVQRTAMTAAANCCRRLSPESFEKAKDVMPIIKNVLSYSDQRLVESACRCIVRLIDSYRHHTELLEQLLTNDVVASINAILLPGSTESASNTTISVTVYTDVLKGLGVAARVSPTVAVTMLENNIVETLYLLLTGSTAPSVDGKGGHGPAVPSTLVDGMDQANVGAAVAVIGQDGSENVAMADVAVLQNLAQRPKEQVQEALSLVAELLPPLPRDGIFDPRQYTEKAYHKRKARTAKVERHAEKRSTGQSTPTSSESPGRKVDSAGELTIEKANDDQNVSATAFASKPERPKTEREKAKERAQVRRAAALREKQALVKRFTRLVLPTLVEVYAASVGWSVRSKALYGILKIVSFVEPEPLLEALNSVPLASFVASVLSSRDHPMLVQGALQLVELLTTKLPDVYSALLRREGVMWEIEDIASKEPSAKSKDAKEKTKAHHEDEGNTTLAVATAEQDSDAPRLPAMALPTSNLSRLLAATGAITGSMPTLTSSVSARHVAGAAPSMATVGGHVMSATDAQDSNIWRARVLCDHLSPDASKASAGGADEAGRALNEIKALVSSLQDDTTDADERMQATLSQIAALFSKEDSPISSFELLRSGLVEGLYRFAIGDSDVLPQEVRRSILVQAFMRHGDDNAKPSAAAILVRRLQETLSRLENVEITTAIYSGEESRRSPTANVARQVRLKLIAEGAEEGEIPRSCTNIVVSIHAITSFQSLHDYLRPKIAASQALAGASASSSAPGPSSGLSSMLESLASSAGIEMSTTLRESLRAAASASASGSTSNSIGQASMIASGSADSARKSDKAEGSSRSPAKDEGNKAEKTSRRRSSRLSAKAGSASENADGVRQVEETKNASEDAESDNPDVALARRLVEGLLQGDMEGLDGDEAFSDDYDDDFVDDDGISGLDTTALGASADETIQVDVSQDGEAKASANSSEQPDSSLSRSAPAGASSPAKPVGGAAGKISYASALQKRPVDWHLEFEMDGEKISLDSTIYSAVHRHETRDRASLDPSSLARHVWANTYTVKYRKVTGPVSETRSATRGTPEPCSKADEVGLPESIADDAPYARILQLLRVLYNLNREWRESHAWQTGDARASVALNETAFVNNKLTAKLNRQLEEPMIVASSCMPAWSTDLPRAFPFLFPFEARYAFLQSTSFGYHRLINRWQTQQSRNQDGASSTSSAARHDDSLALLGRLTRQKVRISRSNILASAFKVFELYGTNSSLLEVEYFDEVGTGLGPTLEFYAMVSKEFARKSTEMWRSDDGRSGDSAYVYASDGLFPAPIDHAELQSAKGKSRVQSFKILGQFVAKALFDSRIVDLNFSTVFMRAILNERVPPTLGMLHEVDETLAKSLESLRSMPAKALEGLALDFTLPGYAAYELHPGGNDETVTSANVEQYIDEIVTHTLVSGVKPLVRAFRQGFDLIFPVSSMSTFTPEELVMLFGNQEEDWSEPTLLASIKPDHGYNVDSSTFRDVIAVMAEFTTSERREFLQWLTGSPKLPIGGFMGLHPQLTIVKRTPDANLTADQTLPSVMTCVNFCKMPPFSGRAVMKQRLLLAMREGQASFHLS